MAPYKLQNRTSISKFVCRFRNLVSLVEKKNPDLFDFPDFFSHLRFDQKRQVFLMASIGQRQEKRQKSHQNDLNKIWKVSAMRSSHIKVRTARLLHLNQQTINSIVFSHSPPIENDAAAVVFEQ